MRQTGNPGKTKQKASVWRLGLLKAGLSKAIHFFFPGMYWKHAAWSALHSIWLIALVMLWLGYVNVMDGFGFMNDHMNMRAFVNDVVLRKPPPDNISDRYLVINTSKNNALMPLDNDNTINTVITDRRLLAEKLKILDEHSDKIAFVLCDVFFEFPSADVEADSLLQEVIQSLSAKQKFVMPAYYNDQERTMVPPVFEGTTGLSQYRSSYLNEQFLKYSFILYGKHKQAPLVAFEGISGKTMEKKKLWFIPYYTLGGRWALNTIIPEFRYIQSDFVEGLSYFHLGLFEDYFIGEGQVVVIGDIEGVYDVHQTISAFAAGPIVLINILESLRNGDNIIALGYLLLLFVVFFYVTYHTFFYKRELPEGKSLFQRIWFFVLEKWSYFVILALVYVSMIFFHHYIHILILLSYFGLIETTGAILRKKREQQEV
ncbi:MAG: hypothetical protein V2I46_10215 [Bacteroides sp.]|jgi:hypothetical protein|nr:hypothetical protein [Bacteroides sp.]